MRKSTKIMIMTTLSLKSFSSKSIRCTTVNQRNGVISASHLINTKQTEQLSKHTKVLNQNQSTKLLDFIQP